MSIFVFTFFKLKASEQRKEKAKLSQEDLDHFQWEFKQYLKHVDVQSRESLRLNICIDMMKEIRKLGNDGSSSSGVSLPNILVDDSNLQKCAEFLSSESK